jgi:signal transduction histidine kinase
MKNPKHSPAVRGEVLLCAPFGKDAEILTEIVSLEGLGVIHCASLSELVCRFSEITDFMLLTEEALVSSSFLGLQEVLRKQEPWSDVPIILLASAGVTALSLTTQFLSKLGADANISILERPVRMPTILSVVRTARRARNRQREIQRLLLQEKDSASQLRSARDELEQRVNERTFELSRTNLDLTREIKERERAERDLHNLSATVLHIQDDERRRIARDLHDGVGQTLTGAVIAASRVRSCQEPLPVPCEPGLREVEDLLQDAIREVRTVSYLLHPPLLDESGLLSAIRWYSKGFSDRSGIKLTVALDEQTERLGRDVETGIFRIIQEALTNVHRHSGAKAVRITLTCADGYLRLRIQDDGKGIPWEVLRGGSGGPKGVGLASMRERSTLIGGAFEIESSSKGTLILVTVPLNMPKESITA